MASTNVATIHQDDVFILVGGVRMQGFAPGQYFSASPLNDAFTTIQGPDGETIDVRNGNTARTVTITLLQSSISNGVLWGFHQADMNTPGGVLVPLYVQHQGTVKASATFRITRAPDDSFGDAAENRVWTGIAHNYEGTLAGITSG